MPLSVSRGASPHRAHPRSLRCRGGISRPAAVAIGGVVAALTACGDDDLFRRRADVATATDTLVVFPLGGPQPLLPAGVSLVRGTAVRPQVSADGSVNFDFALDVDASGRVVFYPPRLLAASRVVPQTGFQLADRPFDEFTSAPTADYRTDSATTAAVGATLAVRTEGAAPATQAGVACGSTAPLYAKLTLDSVSAATGGVHVRVLRNPNCGFRSLAPGLPTF